MESASAIYERASGAYTSQNYSEARELFDRIIDEYPLSDHAISALYLRARGYEDGHFVEGIRLDLALQDFQALSKASASGISLGLVGMARVRYQQGYGQHIREIVDLCQQAIAIDSNSRAMMLLGLVYEIGCGNYPLARRWYFKAFMQGLPWGMRYVAYTYAEEKKHVKAFLCHSIATIVSPLLMMKNGIVTPFH